MTTIPRSWGKFTSIRTDLLEDILVEAMAMLTG